MPRTSIYDNGGFIGATAATPGAASGIWSLDGIFPAPLSTVSFVAVSGNATTTSSSSATATISASAAVGDIAIAAYSIDASSYTLSTPTGWTLIGNGDTSEFPRMYVFAKILEAGDSGSTLSSTISTAEGFSAIIAVFRPDTAITSFTGRNFTNTKGPASLSDTLSSTGATPLTVAFAFLTGKPAQSPTLTFSGSYIQTDSTGGGTRSVGYIVYENGSTPTNHSVSSDDRGRQSLSAFYLDLA